MTMTRNNPSLRKFDFRRPDEEFMAAFEVLSEVESAVADTNAQLADIAELHAMQVDRIEALAARMATLDSKVSVLDGVVTRLDDGIADLDSKIEGHGVALAAILDVLSANLKEDPQPAAGWLPRKSDAPQPAASWFARQDRRGRLALPRSLRRNE